LQGACVSHDRISSRFCNAAKSYIVCNNRRRYVTRKANDIRYCTQRQQCLANIQVTEANSLNIYKSRAGEFVVQNTVDEY